MSWFGPPPVTNNGLRQKQANAALVKALHNVANVKLSNALKAVKNVANASAATKNARIKELEAALDAAKPAVSAATAAAPAKPVEPATETAVNAFIRRIEAKEFNNKFNNVLTNNAYKTASVTNRNRIAAASTKRRANLAKERGAMV